MMLRRKTERARRSHLGFESLETRSLLSALHATHAVHVDAADHHGAHVNGHQSAEVAKASHSTSQSTNHREQAHETHLVATLAPPPGTASTASGTAKVTSETEHGSVATKLVAKVKDAPPGSSLDVSIDGAKAGQISVSPKGTGELSVKSNVPPAGAGSTVLVTDSSTHAEVLSGKLGAASSGDSKNHDSSHPANDSNGTVQSTKTLHATNADQSTGGDHSNVGDHSQVEDHSHDSNDSNSAASETHLAASFTDPTNPSFSGSARYESNTEHGLVVSEFSVNLKGLAPGTKIDVSITDAAGTTSTPIGQITVGANGKGKLELVSHPYENSQQPFPANFPTVGAGSQVTLTLNNAGNSSTISGVLAVPAPSKHK